MDRFLIVDDEAPILEVLELALAQDSVQLVTATSIEQALQLCDSGDADEITLSVIDKNLPDGSGLELARELKSRYQHHETILMTGYATLDSAIEGVTAGLFDYVCKPFDVAVMLDRVASALERVHTHKERHQRLVHTYRMQSLGMLAASIGHEINNPLAYVLNNLELMRENHTRVAQAIPRPTLHELETLAEGALDGVHRIRSIVRDLSRVARQEPEERVSVFDVNDAVRSAVSLVKNQLRHSATVSVDLRPTPAVLGNQNRLTQVTTNLLLNAAYAVSLVAADKRNIVVSSAADSNGWAQVTVRDTGCGIEPEDLERIFESYFTTKPPGEGTGLGLAITKRYVESLDGRMDVASGVGVGTTFSLRLPPATTTVSRSVPPVSRPADRGPGRVLLIDDDRLVLSSMRRCLAQHDVVTAKCARDAIALLEGDRNFDVIFCDFMMPDGTGIDVYEHLLELDPDTAEKLVFMTGGVFTARTAAFAEDSPVRVLEKPIGIADLRALVAGRVARNKKR